MLCRHNQFRAGNPGGRPTPGPAGDPPKKWRATQLAGCIFLNLAIVGSVLTAWLFGGICRLPEDEVSEGCAGVTFPLNRHTHDRSGCFSLRFYMLTGQGL